MQQQPNRNDLPPLWVAMLAQLIVGGFIVFGILMCSGKAHGQPLPFPFKGDCFAQLTEVNIRLGISQKELADRTTLLLSEQQRIERFRSTLDFTRLKSDSLLSLKEVRLIQLQQDANQKIVFLNSQLKESDAVLDTVVNELTDELLTNRFLGWGRRKGIKKILAMARIRIRESRATAILK